MATNKDVYPITAELEEGLKDLMGTQVIRAIVETVGEYEHGVAEVIDVFEGVDLLFGEGEEEDPEDRRMYSEREALRAYAAVAHDVALIIANMEYQPFTVTEADEEMAEITGYPTLDQLEVTARAMYGDRYDVEQMDNGRWICKPI